MEVVQRRTTAYKTALVAKGAKQPPKRYQRTLSDMIGANETLASQNSKQASMMHQCTFKFHPVQQTYRLLPWASNKESH